MHQHLRLTALAAACTMSVACSGGTSATPLTPPVTTPSFATQSLMANADAATSTSTAFNAHDETGAPIARTHVMLPFGVTPPAERNVPAAMQSPLRYHGGDVQTNPKIFVVYWGFASDPNGEAARLTAFLKAIGASSWLNTVAQYYQKPSTHISNVSGQLKGAWTDTTNPIPAHPTDAQVADESIRLAEHFGVYSPNAAYIVATASGHNIHGFPNQFCAYHGSIPTHGTIIAYTNLPYQSDAGQYCGAGSVNNGAAGKIDGVTIVGGHELAETQTDPGTSQYGGGWWDGGGNEIGDKCAWVNLKDVSFGSFGSFPTQPLYSNSANACVQ